MMQGYCKFLKRLLALNIAFIVIVAGMGLQLSLEERDVAFLSSDTSQTAAPASVTADSSEVIPMGQTVGIYINTDGILVIDTGEITGLDGIRVAPAKNKLMPGDYIIKLNGEEMRTKKQLIAAITSCRGNELVFTVRRNEETIEVQVEPVETEPCVYKVGIWVRDDLQGLGTVTYVEGNAFGALGHSINDTDTGELLQVSGGEIYAADIFGVEKGSVGKPGEIEGMIAYQTENVVGEIEENKLYGIYGTISEDFSKQLGKEVPVSLAKEDEVEIGAAQIQSYVSGEKELYDIEITNIHKNRNGDLEMEIVVTDDNLIALTGGIVQGMSGSPILQNGKLVGAVTHVFVEEPKKGYGIFVETMRNDEK